MRPLNFCMLVVAILLLLCEVIFSQLCKSLITLVDGFHTLFILLRMALPPPQTRTLIKPAGSSMRPPFGPQTATAAQTPQPHHDATSLVQLCSPQISPPALDCGVSYTNSRVYPVGIFFSTLLLASLCISYLIEIISFCLEPHPVQRPLLLVVVGAASLLHKMLLLRMNWNQTLDERAETHRHPENDSNIVQMFNRKVLAKKETEDRADPGRGLVDVDQVHSAVDSFLHNGALVLCNPETSIVPEAGCRTPEQQPQVHLHAAGPQKMWDSDLANQVCDVSVSKCESHSRNIPGILKEGQKECQTSSLCTTSHHTEEPITSCPWPACILSLLVLQGLFTSLLALANSLVMLLIRPEYLNSTGTCSFWVYLDPALSLLAVIMLITTVWPQMCRYGLLLLQATPPHICLSELERRITNIPGVQGVHDLHVWQLAESLIVASVHIHCTARLPAHRCADLMSGVTMVLQKVGVSCCTVQPEFASCSGSSAGSGCDDTPVVHTQDHFLPPLLACSLACGKTCARSMCCSPREDTKSLSERPAGETKAEPQTLIFENSGGK